MRTDEEPLLGKELRTDIQGKRKRGRPKTRWTDACQRDMRRNGRGDGQGDMEKENHQSYRRPYMMRKARGNQGKARESQGKTREKPGKAREKPGKSHGKARENPGKRGKCRSINCWAQYVLAVELHCTHARITDCRTEQNGTELFILTVK